MTLHILASTLDTSTNRITESLNIENDCVLWYRGGTIFQKFSYPGQSITRALLVEFADQEIQFQQTHSNSKCAVIIIADTVYIYDVDGPSYQINLPFTVQRAESYGLGVILERVLSERDPNVQTKFFTLSDPILDLGIAASSSVSAMSTDEELLFVDNSHKSSIYLTNDPASHMVHFYHARYLSNKISKANTKRRSSTRRKSSMVYRTVDSGSEDVSVDLDALGSARDITDYHINRSGDYTGQQVYSATNSQSFSHLTSLRKDIILTHLAKFRINAYTADLKVLSISDEEKEVIAIVNRKTSEATLHTFNKAIGPISLPSIESSQSFEICDIALLGDQSLLFMLSGDGSASIFHPLLNIRSPTIKFSPMSSIIASYSDSSIVVETDKGVHTTIRMKFKPRSELVTMCFKSLELLLDPLSLQYLNFLWDSALFLGSYDDEWVPFMATILSSLLEHKEASLDHVKECSHDILEAIKLSKSLSKSEFGSQFDFSEIKQYIIFSLHLIREEFKLQVSCNGHVQKLGNLLNWLVSQARWSKEWIEYYECKNSVIIPGK